MCINSNVSSEYNYIECSYMNDLKGAIDYSGSYYASFISGNRKYIYISVSLFLRKSAFKKLKLISIQDSNGHMINIYVLGSLKSIEKPFNLSVYGAANGSKQFWIGPAEIYYRNTNTNVFEIVESSWLSLHFNVSDPNTIYLSIPSNLLRRGTETDYMLSMSSIQEVR